VAARHLEVERFALKADGYRAALETSPEARSLEVAVIAALLRGCCADRGWNPANVKVVDLMAGSGFLGNFLYKVGFKQVWALEACDEMVVNHSAIEGVRHQRLHDWEELHGRLREIEPHFIVSLAGFHHLIEYDGKRLNRAASVIWQAEIIRECLSELRDDGLVMIVDLVEPTAISRHEWRTFSYWDPSVFGVLHSLPPSIRSRLQEAKSLQDYEKIIENDLCGGRSNPALRWFREVVDEKTEVGHEDIALSQELLRLMRQYRGVKFAHFSCPWIFSSRIEAGFFLSRKFGFLIGRKDIEKVEAEVLEESERIVGLHEVAEGRIVFDWNLAALAIPGTKCRNKEKWVYEANAISIVTLLLLGFRLGLKSLFFGHFQEWVVLLDPAIWMAGGFLAKTFLSFFVDRRLNGEQR